MRLVKYRGHWCAYWREDGQPKRISLRTSNRETAEQQLADLKLDLTRNVSTVEKIVELYLEDKKGKPSHSIMEFSWKAAKDHFSNLKPEHITRQVCRDYSNKRKELGLSNSSIRREIGIVRAAVKWHSPNAPAVFELPPTTPPMERYLTREEFDKLLNAAKSEHIKLFIRLAVTTAGRKTAILELTWDRVDFERKIISLGTGERRIKGRAVVPMQEKTYTALLEAKKGALTDYVIEHGGKPVKIVNKAFKRAVESAGLKNVSPHTLRHTAAVWMAESGAAMSEIAAYLGHSDSRITERVYARYSPNHLRKVSAILDV